MGIINWSPEATPMQFAVDHSVYSDRTGKAERENAQRELDRDAVAPIISEAFLYNLLGKDDARTYMARVRALARVCGFELEELYLPECIGCGLTQHPNRPCPTDAEDKKRRGRR